MTHSHKGILYKTIYKLLIGQNPQHIILNLLISPKVINKLRIEAKLNHVVSLRKKQDI